MINFTFFSFFINLVTFQVPSEPIYIVTEFMVNGSLLDYLRTGEGRRTTFPDHVDIAAQVGGRTQIKSSLY